MINQEDFIELNRTFYSITDSFDSYDFEEINDFRWLRGEVFNWNEIINYYRIVILAEAGAGKTSEIRHRALKLRSEKKYAFFIRLEQLSNGLEYSFEVGNYDEFKGWLNSNEEGWLLLDSVDEARLKSPTDFEQAIGFLSRCLSSALQRVHIIITSRGHAWRPKTDLDYCNKCLPYVSTDILTEKVSNQVESETKEIDYEIAAVISNKDKSWDNSGFKFYTLSDLTERQIEKFITWLGVQDTATFLSDIERNDAKKFTTRPQDLEEIVGFWNKNKRIENRSKLMQDSINRRLQERDQNRAERESITFEKAKSGVSLIGAATTFMNESTLNVLDGNYKTQGISVRSILSDWSVTECQALLSRPIFDEAIYGTVRFHHRDVREYLTAEWLHYLLIENSSRRKIENLFFRDQYGVCVIPPKMKPVLSWLVLFDDKIREKTYKTEPEIFLQGGDPSSLPYGIRSEILRSVCEKISLKTSNQKATEFRAIQRFANPDLANVINELIKEYHDDFDVIIFLLKMVWQGRIEQSLKEVKPYALNSKVEEYVRVSAIQALGQIGTKEDHDEVLETVLSEFGLISRGALSTLIREFLDESEKSIKWIIKALEKTEEKEKYRTDTLVYALINFIDRLNPILLKKFINLSLPLINEFPNIERRYRTVSQKFVWLMDPCLKAIEKLISKKSKLAMNPSSLALLTRAPVLIQDKELDFYTNDKGLAKMIQDWDELNHALFWVDVKEKRRVLSQKNQRLTDFWKLIYFDKFWHFDKDHFEVIRDDIKNRNNLDDKLVALSLAFQLYIENDRPKKWREQLKLLVADQPELREKLSQLLNPPPLSDEVKRLKRRHAQREKREKTRKEREEFERINWIKKLKKNHERLIGLDLPKGKTSPEQDYLFERMNEKTGVDEKCVKGDWEALINVYGEEVANSFRQGLLNYWRNYKPTFRTEKEYDNRIPYEVTFGLAGLEIEAQEIPDWPANLNEMEAETACRYAFVAWNSFPSWFSKLHSKFTDQVNAIIFREIRWELENEDPDDDKFYAIGKISYSAPWLWNSVGLELFKFLNKEPKNLQYLTYLLKIIQGSSNVADEDIAQLAISKCRTNSDQNHLALWFAVLVGTDPKIGIEMLSEYLCSIKNEEATKIFAMKFVVKLVGTRGAGSPTRDNYKTPENLQKLYLLMHNYIKMEEDINRANTGVFSPGLRDEAQEAREILLYLIKDIPGKSSYEALIDISDTHPNEKSRKGIKPHAKERAEIDADISPWSEQRFLEFIKSLENTPTNHRELFDLAVQRLLDLKYDLEEGDTSIYSILVSVQEETLLRNFIGDWCRTRAYGRYSIIQEEELSDAKRPDLRFYGVGFDAPVPVELKIADKWRGSQLFERLENQLCGDYLRDVRSNRGIFLLIFRGEKESWQFPGSRKRITFDELLEALRNYWKEISEKFPQIEQIEVIGIDLTKRESKPRFL